MDEVSSTTDSRRGWSMPHAKLAPPPLPSHFVARPALRRRLVRQVSATAVTLLCAPPGYGKTTLLADWIETTGGADKACVSLDRDDNAERFLAAVLLAMCGCAAVPADSRLRTMYRKCPVRTPGMCSPR
jgi:LuxR family maltose regulon positive regulatory protein